MWMEDGHKDSLLPLGHPRVQVGPSVADRSDNHLTADSSQPPLVFGSAPAALVPQVRHPVGARVVLFFSFALDLLLYSLVVSFLPTRTQALGATPAITGALFAVYAAGLLLATPPAGWLTDRLGARSVLLAGLVALFCATLLFAFADSLPSLALARAGQGVASGVTWTSGLALMVQLYEPTHRPRAFAAMFMASGIGVLLGPPLGGLLYTWGGFSAPFFVAAALVALDGGGRILFLPGRAHLPVSSPASARTLWRLLHEAPFVVGLVATSAGAIVFSSL